MKIIIIIITYFIVLGGCFSLQENLFLAMIPKQMQIALFYQSWMPQPHYFLQKNIQEGGVKKYSNVTLFMIFSVTNSNCLAQY